MPVWLRLKRGSFLEWRRYTNNCMIILWFLFQLYHYTLSLLRFPCLSRTCSFLFRNPTILHLPSWQAMRASFPESLLCFPLPSLPKFLIFSSSLIHITAYYYFTLLVACNMPRVVSFSVKTSALLIALVLVPIVVLCCCLAVAIACSEYWSSRSSRCSCCPRIRFRWFKALKGRKRKHSDPTSSSSTETPGLSATPSVYGDPVLVREQV